MRFERWAIALVAVILAAAGSACQGRPAGPSETARPTSTPPPPASPTATATQAVLKIETPTPTPAPASASVCPEDPRAWQLVPLQAGLRDPKTGKPIQLPKPPQRIDPPCVYEGLARDLARSLVPNPDFPTPAVRGKTLSVPWFWAPGMEAPTIGVEVETVGSFEASYDAGGRRIEELFLPYTAVATGDPDYPVLVYVYRDLPGVAWALGRRVESEEPFQWLRIRLEGGEVARFVSPAVYEAKTRRWVWIQYAIPLPPRDTHAVPAGSAEDVAKLFGLPLWRRGELLARFGLKDIFPDAVDPAKARLAFTVIVRPDGAEARR
ncbi:hypothetical protein [Thermoflexus sp.]|jgi:hypothetical protein|uniref:hypothetical protein n=1 Tax=Thermoflexus sp. TaxID=1969742 RepID=UPI003BFDA17E